MKIHMYQSRHLFVDDDCVGKFNAPTKTIHLFEKFAGYGEAIARWLRQHHGCFPKIATGDATVEQVAPLAEFPPAIVEAMSPFLGDLTPAAIDYAREHFSAEDFERRYRGRATREVVAETAETVPFPKTNGDRVREILEGAGVADWEVTEDPAVGGWTVRAKSHPDLVGSGDDVIEAAQDFVEAIEYAAMTKPADPVEDEDDDGVEPVAEPVEEAPAEEAKPAAKKATKKAAKEA